MKRFPTIVLFAAVVASIAGALALSPPAAAPQVDTGTTGIYVYDHGKLVRHYKASSAWMTSNGVVVINL